MSVVLLGSTSGSITLQEPAIAGTTVLDLPNTSGSLVVTSGAQTVQFGAGSAAAPSITFTGDTNTGIFSPTADTIAFAEGGVESMRIDSSGNMGIGTTSPSSRLNVSSTTNRAYVTVQSTATTAGPEAGISYKTANREYLNFCDYDSQALRWYDLTAATERMRIDTNGNVNINTTTAYDPNGYIPGGSKFLTIRSTAEDRGSFLSLVGGGGGSNGYWQGGISFSVAGQSYPGAAIYGLTGSTTTSGILSFRTSPDTSTFPVERARFTSGGNFLVGGTTPIGTDGTL